MAKKKKKITEVICSSCGWKVKLDEDGRIICPECEAVLESPPAISRPLGLGDEP